MLDVRIAQGVQHKYRLLRRPALVGIDAQRYRITNGCAYGKNALDILLGRTTELHLAPNPALGPDALRELLGPRTDALALRIRPAFKLALLERCARRTPFLLSALHLDDHAFLSLPAEPFIDFQLYAQSLRPGRTVAVAAYGDGGPWYIPTRAEFPAGGYEVDFAFCAPESDALLRSALATLLA